MTFSIIKFRNGRNTAEISFDDGITYTVHKKEKIFILEYVYMMPVPDYQTHFVFENPTTKFGTSAYMCTCGCAAIVVGSNIYKQHETPHGAMLVCHSHATFGKHADGSK